MFRVITIDEIVYEMDGRCNYIDHSHAIYLRCYEKGKDCDQLLTMFPHSQVARVENIIDVLKGDKND